MTITLVDVFMLTGLRVTGSYNPREFMASGKKKIGKISETPNWTRYMSAFKGTTITVNDIEHIAFLNMWLEKFLFCGITLGPTVNNLCLAELLSTGNDIQMGKILLGSFYQMMNKVSLKLLGNKAVGSISGPWWLLQLWLNLYMYKFIRPNLRNLPFPSSQYAEESKAVTWAYGNYGEAALALSLNLERGELFKLFYRGFDENHLIWLPYNDEEHDELIMPVKFRFDTGCSNPTAIGIFNCIIRPCALPTGFYHSRGKTSNPDHFPSYEFYNPSFVSRQLGFGQLPPFLYFLNILKPREGISIALQSNRIFTLGDSFSQYTLSEWKLSPISSVLYDGWWEEWHAHIFCKSALGYC